MALVFANLISRIEFDWSTECWNWTMYRNEDGYGRLSWNGRLRSAHRLSKYLYGEITWKQFKDKSLVLMHTCDNPPCINPYHLKIGTQLENIADRVKKGRCARGEKKWSSKMKDPDVILLRELWDLRYSAEELSEIFNIAVPTVKQIAYRQKWKHLK